MIYSITYIVKRKRDFIMREIFNILDTRIHERGGNLIICTVCEEGLYATCRYISLKNWYTKRIGERKLVNCRSKVRRAGSRSFLSGCTMNAREKEEGIRCGTNCRGAGRASRRDATRPSAFSVIGLITPIASSSRERRATSTLSRGIVGQYFLRE